LESALLIELALGMSIVQRAQAVAAGRMGAGSAQVMTTVPSVLFLAQQVGLLGAHAPWADLDLDDWVALFASDRQEVRLLALRRFIHRKVPLKRSSRGGCS
jgi:hypothetical protein